MATQKKKKEITIDFIFWTFIFIRAIYELLLGTDLSDLLDIFKMGSQNFIISIFELIILFLIYTISSLGNSWYITIFYIGIKLAKKSNQIEKLEINDFINDSYYRESISKYSPGVLSYVDDFKLGKNDIIATLMSLQLKQKIIVEEKVKLINDSTENLDTNEIYVLDMIKEDNLENIDIKTFENKVVYDCLNYKLLEDNSSSDYTTQKIFSTTVFTFLFCIIVGMIIYFLIKLNGIINTKIVFMLLVLMSVIAFFSAIIAPFFAIAYIVSACIIHKSDPYMRNNKARKINQKLEGLRKYIKDYSLLDQKEFDDIKLWDEYLIYSIILGQNTKIVDDTWNKISNPLN